MNDIERAKTKSTKNYEKAMVVFRKKMNEYAKYVAAEVKKNPDKSLKKFPPNHPSDQTRIFADALESLSLHVNDTVTIDDQELHRLMEGFRGSIRAGRTEIASLNALAY